MSTFSVPLPGEICGFRVHNGPSGSGSVQFEAVVLDRSTGEGLVRSKEPLDCESQREHSFTIQAYDCGEGPDGVNSKKSHKLVHPVIFNLTSRYVMFLTVITGVVWGFLWLCTVKTTHPFLLPVVTVIRLSLLVFCFPLLPSGPPCMFV